MVNRLDYKNLLQGSSDICLNHTGITQVTQLSCKLIDIAFDDIICSPLLRSLQTAKIKKGIAIFL